MRNKKFKWLWLALPFLLVLLFGIVYVVSAMEGITEERPKAAEVESVQDMSGSAQESESSEANETNITSETSKTSNIGTKMATEEDFMLAIHQMTHQKVKAYPKWGALEITAERIQQMLDRLSDVEYKNEAFYQETLEAWKNGDFSNVVDTHNQIWEWSDGTIGKASRLLTEKEEAKYIETNFR